MCASDGGVAVRPSPRPRRKWCRRLAVHLPKGGRPSAMTALRRSPCCAATKFKSRRGTGGDGCTGVAANPSGSSFKRDCAGPQQAGAGARSAVVTEGVESPSVGACGSTETQVQAQAARQQHACKEFLALGNIGVRRRESSVKKTAYKPAICGYHRSHHSTGMRIASHRKSRRAGPRALETTACAI